MMGRKNKAEKFQTDHQVQAPGLSVSLPLYRVIRVRMLMLTVMFLLGVVTQFLMAIYAPEVWNYFYIVMKNITSG